MRRKRAKQIRRLAVALMAAKGVTTSPYQVVERTRRGSCMRKLERRRREQLVWLAEWHRMNPEVARELVPAPRPTAEQLIVTGVRAAYQGLKRAYHEGRLRVPPPRGRDARSFNQKD